MTLYFDVELNRDKRPGTEQNTSAGVVTIANPSLLLMSLALIPKIRKILIRYYLSSDTTRFDTSVSIFF